jgi:hypothetical protein
MPSLHQSRIVAVAAAIRTAVTAERLAPTAEHPALVGGWVSGIPAYRVRLLAREVVGHLRDAGWSVTFNGLRFRVTGMPPAPESVRVWGYRVSDPEGRVVSEVCASCYRGYPEEVQRWPTDTV